jgi:hypothetical protein
MAADLAAKVKSIQATVTTELAKARKAAVAVAGVVAYLLAHNYLNGDVKDWADAVLALAAPLGVYVTPNKPAA